MVDTAALAELLGALAFWRRLGFELALYRKRFVPSSSTPAKLML